MKSSNITSSATVAAGPPKLKVRVVKNAFVLLGGQAAVVLSSAVTTLALARQLGAEQFGEYNAVLAFVGLFLPVATFGLEVILLREMAQNPTRASEILGAGITVRLATSLVAILLCVACSVGFGYSAQEIRLISLWSLSLLFSAGQLFQTPFALGLNNARPVGVTSTVAMIGALIKLAMILAGMQLAWYLVLDLGVAILTSALLWHAVQVHSDIRPKWSADRQIWKRLFIDCAPLLLTGVFVAIYHRIDQQFLLMWKGAQELGQYAAAVKLAELLALFPAFLMRSAFPIISSSTNQPERDPLAMSATCYRYLFLIAFLPIFAGTVFSASVIKLLYGPAYSASAAALPWLLAAEVPVIAGVVYGYFSVASRLQRFDVLFTFVGVLTNLILCVVFIPEYGIVGAAIASLVSYTIGIPVQLFFTATRRYSLVLIREALRFTAVGGLTWAAFAFTKQLLPLPGSLVLTAGVFLIAAMQLKLITRQDLRFIFA